MKLEVGTLQELNVKPGDVVEYTECGPGGHRTVAEMCEPFWKDDKGEFMAQSSPHWRIISRASTTPSPVRTVTSLEIVPGVYGKVHVDMLGGLGVSVEELHTVDEITAAIETLTAIRDAMENNA